MNALARVSRPAFFFVFIRSVVKIMTLYFLAKLAFYKWFCNSFVIVKIDLIITFSTHLYGSNSTIISFSWEHTLALSVAWQKFVGLRDSPFFTFFSLRL